MKKSILYAAILAAATAVPNRHVELGKLKPVETISIGYQENYLIIETDTGDIGIGSGVTEALKDLKETTAGTIYLDTAEYLIVENEAREQIEKLRPWLKRNVRICEKDGQLDITKVSEYLRAHRPEVTLKQWEKHISLQVLETENGRMKLK